MGSGKNFYDKINFYDFLVNTTLQKSTSVISLRNRFSHRKRISNDNMIRPLNSGDWAGSVAILIGASCL